MPLALNQVKNPPAELTDSRVDDLFSNPEKIEALGRYVDTPAVEPGSIQLSNIEAPVVQPGAVSLENDNLENRYTAPAPAASRVDAERSAVAKPPARDASSEKIQNLTSVLANLNPSVPRWTDIKHDPAAIDIVRLESRKKFLVDEFDFLEAVDDLKNVDIQKNPDVYLNKSTLIVDKFVRPDSTHQVNISSKLTNEILNDHRKIVEDPNLVVTNCNMFDKCEHEVSTLLDQNLMAQVSKNPEFSPYLADHAQRSNERVDVMSDLIKDYTHQGEIQRDLNALDSEIGQVSEQREQLALKDTARKFDSEINKFEALADQSASADQSVLLKSVLDDPVAQKQFEKHLQSEYSPENLQFYNEVQKFQNAPDQTRAEKIAQLQFIRDMYMVEGSERQVNISGDLRNTFVKNVENLEKPDAIVDDRVLDGSKEEIVKIMSSDSLKRFKKNPEFLQYQSTVRDTILPSYKEQLDVVNSQIKPAEQTASYSQDAVLLDQQINKLVADRGFKVNNLAVVNKNIQPKETRLNTLEKPAPRPAPKPIPKASPNLIQRFFSVFSRRK